MKHIELERLMESPEIRYEMTVAWARVVAVEMVRCGQTGDKIWR